MDEQIRRLQVCFIDAVFGPSSSYGEPEKNPETPTAVESAVVYIRNLTLRVSLFFDSYDRNAGNILLFRYGTDTSTTESQLRWVCIRYTQQTSIIRRKQQAVNILDVGNCRELSGSSIKIKLCWHQFWLPNQSGIAPKSSNLHASMTVELILSPSLRQQESSETSALAWAELRADPLGAYGGWSLIPS